MGSRVFAAGLCMKIITREKICCKKVRTSAKHRVCSTKTPSVQYSVLVIISAMTTGWMGCLVLNSTRARLHCYAAEFNAGCVTLIREVT